MFRDAVVENKECTGIPPVQAQNLFWFVAVLGPGVRNKYAEFGSDCKPLSWEYRSWARGIPENLGMSQILAGNDFANEVCWSLYRQYEDVGELIDSAYARRLVAARKFDAETVKRHDGYTYRYLQRATRTVRSHKYLRILNGNKGYLPHKLFDGIDGVRSVFVDREGQDIDLLLLRETVNAIMNKDPDFIHAFLGGRMPSYKTWLKMLHDPESFSQYSMNGGKGNVRESYKAGAKLTDTLLTGRLLLDYDDFHSLLRTSVWAMSSDWLFANREMFPDLADAGSRLGSEMFEFLRWAGMQKQKGVRIPDHYLDLLWFAHDIEADEGVTSVMFNLAYPMHEREEDDIDVSYGADLPELDGGEFDLDTAEYYQDEVGGPSDNLPFEFADEEDQRPGGMLNDLLTVEGDGGEVLPLSGWVRNPDSNNEDDGIVCLAGDDQVGVMTYGDLLRVLGIKGSVRKVAELFGIESEQIVGWLAEIRVSLPESWQDHIDNDGVAYY